jgi:hypothetical protein
VHNQYILKINAEQSGSIAWKNMNYHLTACKNSEQPESSIIFFFAFYHTMFKKQ